ncbi:hypothetical protein OsI_12170 [Oryza sativa Indica Group]|uniref:No apical meristem-associated C-terminal domain-containing protein n=1 Tax=Oryza sativa subsp. indica TaxID=39946 RepID=A2XIA9_ORYSI|nr:hypothetical protein OsI_12170 [Oryza sativa Indica Group]
MDSYVNLLGSNIDVETWDPSQNFPQTRQQPQYSPMVGEQPSAEVGGPLDPTIRDPKISALRKKKQKANVDPLVIPSARTNSREFHCSPDINISDPLVRPPGWKVEKAKHARGDTSSCSSESSLVVIALTNMWSEKKEMSAQSREERNDRLGEVISLEKERLKVEKRKLDLETHEREERIMNMDLRAMDGPRKAYYLRLQEEIIKAHMD